MSARSVLAPLSDRSEARRSARLAETLARRSSPEFADLGRRAAEEAAEVRRVAEARRRAEVAARRPATDREVRRVLDRIDEAVSDARSDFPEVGDVDLVPEIARAVLLDVRGPVAREVRRGLGI